jgi:hypothetical protein
MHQTRGLHIPETLKQQPEIAECVVAESRHSTPTPTFCPSSVAPRLRTTAVATALLALLLAAPRCEAQWYSGWYGGWSGEGSTPLSSAVKAQANLVAAEGQAAESYGAGGGVSRTCAGTVP